MSAPSPAGPGTARIVATPATGGAGSPVRVVSVLGARPNFVKMAPVIARLNERLPAGAHLLVHTGQHYDRLLSEVLFEDLGMSAPDRMLDVGSGSHAIQTARVMERLEPVLTELEPELVIVPGDVNSTLAAALVASKLQIPIAHVESGLRSFDRRMPEEINRLLTDQLAELLFVHSPEAIANLAAEGVAADKVHFIGNTMIDSLIAVEHRFRGLDQAAKLGVRRGDYLLVTLHRPALVDGPLLEVVLAELAALARELPVIFPMHPRTRKMAERLEQPAGVTITDPVGYLEFLSLEADAAGVLTDSGGVQEETTFLGVPCFTLRDSTERPVTITSGTNTLLGLEPERISEIAPRLRADPGGTSSGMHTIPDLWDGRAAERLADVTCSWLGVAVTA